MEAIFSIFFSKMSLASGISEEELDKLILSLPFSLPNDFIDFLRFSNGAEGDIGNNYLVIWRAEDLVPFNKSYSVNLNAPGLFLFGSDGGGEGFGFDYRAGKLIVVDIPFVGMDWKLARKKGNNFMDFLRNLKNIDQY
jgi:hypothetical protein